MQRSGKDILYFETGPDNAPTMWVDPGEEFEVVTQMNRGPWLDDHPDGERLREVLRAGNPSSGCVYINGAEPGMALIVHVGEIETEPFGFTNYRGSTSAMPGWLGDSGVGRHHKVVEIRDGNILWSDTLKIPIAPMLGVVGVAPRHSRWTNAWAGEWGGNFDIQEVTTGRVGVAAGECAGRAAAYWRHACATGRRRDLRRGWHRDGRQGQIAL